MEEKDFKVSFEDITLRRANADDNMEEIARLVYQTDPYIYPFWFDNDIEEATKVLAPLLREPGFLYHYKNCYVAHDTATNKIIGFVCAIDPTSNLDYDYSKLESVNDHYKFTIENYVKPVINETLEKKYMYIVNSRFFPTSPP